MNDAELLAAWRDGNTKAGERLFERYFDAVSRFFINKVPHDPDDLVQETFVACLRGRDRVRQDDSFRSYLFAIACNVLRAYYRRQRRIPDESLLELDECSSYDLAPGPSSVVHAKEEQQLLLEALRRIPLEYQVILELHYWENLTTAEIATVLDAPLGTIRGRLRRGRLRLTEALQDLPSKPQTRRRVAADLDHLSTGLRETLSVRDR